MIIKSIPKKLPTDQPQVQISGVKDGDVYHHAILTNELQMVAASEPGVVTTIEIAPIPQPAAPSPGA